MVVLCPHAGDRVGHSLRCSKTWMNTLSLALRPMKAVEKGNRKVFKVNGSFLKDFIPVFGIRSIQWGGQWKGPRGAAPAG